MGWDGLAALLFSLAAAMATGGLTFLICWTIVLRFARLPSAAAAPGADVILVLGTRLNRKGATREFTTRLALAARLAASRPVAILGGMAIKSGLTEAAAGKSWLVQRGFDQDCILLDNESRNTLENLVNARELMGRHAFRRPILVTSRYHLARTSILAKSLGIAHDLCPTSYPGIWHPTAFFRSLLEALMLNWYYAGRVLARLTRHRGMLARIS
jgi:uncharacterized SAM-binding protein YcdF (DUF218 family)